MELMVKLEFKQILKIIEQLPQDDKYELKKKLDQQLEQSPFASEDKDELTDLLLRGPVMTDEEKTRFDKIEKSFDTWTKNLFY
ncbi:MAG: hypothetical protein K9I94_13365 [Bacteroidales bacterium]|nr:hypothetical protein [Bacteroidales bacterium]